MPSAADLFAPSSTRGRDPQHASSGVFVTAMDGRGLDPLGNDVGAHTRAHTHAAHAHAAARWF